ncbi:hypothetical protein TNCV_4707771 [Trichonephila clavipes]|nr:hypothetical protein TNCV_4707771 [Trichonephila clavipes]
MLSQPWTLARQIRKLSLQVYELTRKHSPLATNDIVLTARDHIHALGVSIEEVASATIIAVIKSRPASVFSPLCICAKKQSKLCHSWNGRALSYTSRLFLLDRKSGQKFLIDSGVKSVIHLLQL